MIKTPTCTAHKGLHPPGI